MVGLPTITNNRNECWSQGRARLRVFRAAMAQKSTQLSPSLNPILGPALYYTPTPRPSAAKRITSRTSPRPLAQLQHNTFRADLIIY